jgi:hypothetical protein
MAGFVEVVGFLQEVRRVRDKEEMPGFNEPKSSSTLDLLVSFESPSFPRGAK